MAICLICDDTGLRNSDSTNPQFCYCAAGKQARRQWEAGKQGKQLNRPASFIDIANLEQVNASVDAMRASLLGNAAAARLTPGHTANSAHGGDRGIPTGRSLRGTALDT